MFGKALLLHVKLCLLKTDHIVTHVNLGIINHRRSIY